MSKTTKYFLLGRGINISRTIRSVISEDEFQQIKTLRILMDNLRDIVVKLTMRSLFIYYCT